MLFELAAMYVDEAHFDGFDIVFSRTTQLKVVESNEIKATKSMTLLVLTPVHCW